MTKKPPADTRPQKNDLPAHRVHLPGFISDEPIGLGDAIQRSTSYLGIRPCEGCKRRTAALNRWLVFTNGRASK